MTEDSTDEAPRATSDKKVSLGIPGVRVSRGCFKFGIGLLLFCGYVAVVGAAHWWGIRVPYAFTPFDDHPPRTAPLHRALSSADKLEIIEVLMLNDEDEDNGSATRPTIIVEDDPVAVRDFVRKIRFIEDPDEFALLYVPSYVLKFYDGEDLLETVHVIDSDYLNWLRHRWGGGTSQLTRESSRLLRSWLEQRGVELEPEGEGCR